MGVLCSKEWIFQRQHFADVLMLLDGLVERQIREPSRLVGVVGDVSAAVFAAPRHAPFLHCRIDRLGYSPAHPPTSPMLALRVSVRVGSAPRWAGFSV